VALPVLARKVKLSAPVKFAPGVYVTLGALPLRRPLLGGATIAKVSGSPLAARPLKVSGSGVW
jgi:hypothetical protein